MVSLVGDLRRYHAHNDVTVMIQAWMFFISVEQCRCHIGGCYYILDIILPYIEYCMGRNA